MSDHPPKMYEGDGDSLMQCDADSDFPRIMLVPDSFPSKVPDKTPRLRIMWGQHLLEDLLAGRYGSVVCAVNAEDNSHGIISQLASLLPTSQWDRNSITAHAKQFVAVGEPGHQIGTVLQAAAIDDRISVDVRRQRGQSIVARRGRRRGAHL